MKEEEKAQIGAKTFQGFCEQFGNDVYSHIFLEVLLEGIINAETLFVFGEQEQGRDQDSDSVTGGGASELGCERSGDSESACNVETSDPTNLPRQPDVISAEDRISDELRGTEENT